MSAPTLIDFGWRGPLHAICKKDKLPDIQNSTALDDVTLRKMRPESIAKIIDGTSKTMLLGESTNIYEEIAANGTITRRTLWAYSWGPFILSQAMASPNVSFDWLFWGDWTVAVYRPRTRIPHPIELVTPPGSAITLEA